MIEEVCNKVSVKKGDVFFIESGTLHAIGSGILIAEVQLNSNLWELRNLASCELFMVDLLELNGEVSLFEKDTFISVVLLEGSLKFEGNNEGGEMKKGSSLFIPAGVTTKLIGKAKVLLSKI